MSKTFFTGGEKIFFNLKKKKKRAEKVFKKSVFNH